MLDVDPQTKQVRVAYAGSGYFLNDATRKHCGSSLLTALLLMIKQSCQGRWTRDTGSVVLLPIRGQTIDYLTQRLKEWFYKPYSRMIRDHPHVAASHPFG